MEWNKRTAAEKVQWLNEQLEDIRRTRGLLDRFERVTQKWHKQLEAQKKPR